RDRPAAISSCQSILERSQGLPMTGEFPVMEQAQRAGGPIGVLDGVEPRAGDRPTVSRPDLGGEAIAFAPPVHVFHAQLVVVATAGVQHVLARRRRAKIADAVV